MTITGNGHDISVASIYLNQISTLSGAGKVTANGGLTALNTSSATLHPGDVIGASIDIESSSTVSVSQATGQLTGLTLNNVSGASTLTLLSPDSLNLTMNNAPSPTEWIFRWQDPAAGGNHVLALKDLIAEGDIVVTPFAGYQVSVVNTDGYTYIEEKPLSPVPEPASIVVWSLILGLCGIGCWRRRLSR